MPSTKLTRFAVVLLATLAGAGACAPSKTTHASQRAGDGGEVPDKDVASNNNTQTTQKENGDDLSVEIAVPMGLVDPVYVASFTKRIPSALLPQKPTFDYCAHPPSPLLPPQIAASINYAEWEEDACVSGVDIPYAYERGVTSEPAGQIHDTRQALLNTQAMMAIVLGKDGYFGTADLKLLAPNGRGVRKFKIPADLKVPEVAEATIHPAFQFAEVSYDKDAKYPYVIDLYEQLTKQGDVDLPDCALKGVLLRSVRLEFAREAGSTTASTVHIQDFRVDPEYPDYCKYSEITYDTGKDVINFYESWDHLEAGVQNKYMTTIEYTKTNAVVTGAVRWNASPDDEFAKKDDPRASRMEYALQDDTDIFRAVALTSGDHETKSIQELAFISGDQHDTWASKKVDSTIFQTNPYVTYEWEHLLKIFRDHTLNAACNTAGNVLRGKYVGGHTVPSLLQSAPANLCDTNTAYTDDQAKSLIAAICLDPTPITYNLGIVDGDGNTSHLCEQYDRVVVMQNPQAIEIVQVTDPDDSSKQVFDAVQHLYHTSPTELLTAHVPFDSDYASLEGALDKGTVYPDLVTLWSDAKWDVPVPKADEFKAAESLH